MPVGVSWEASGEPLGGSFEASWGPFGDLLGFFSFWASCGPLGTSFGPLGGLLAVSGAHLGRRARNVSWSSPSWAPLGAILGRLGRILDRLGAPLGRLGALLAGAS